MQLMTKEIETKARKQYPLGGDMDQLVVAKFFSPTSGWTWYLMNQDPDDPDYLWGIVVGFETEIGSFSLSELDGAMLPLGVKIERDLYFTPRPAKDIYADLMAGKHV